MTLYLLISNLVVNSILLGIILMTQFVNYPLLDSYNENFHTIHQNYMKRMGYLVGPIMVLEFLIISFLFLLNFENKLTAAMFITTCLIWISTFLIQVPVHQGLTNRKEKINTKAYQYKLDKNNTMVCKVSVKLNFILIWWFFF